MPPTTSNLSLLELVDISVGTPEVVNYKGLRTLLLAIVGNLNLGDVKTELLDADKQEMLAANKRTESISRPSSSGFGGRLSPGSQPSDTYIQNLEQKVSKLETQMEVLNSLPSNENLMQRVRSSIHNKDTGSSSSPASTATTPTSGAQNTSGHGSATPVSEMWQLMQVQRKAAANEEGVGKLMSMMEDMMRTIQDVRDQLNKYNQDIKELRDKLNQVNSETSELKSGQELLKSGHDELKTSQDDFNKRLTKLESSNADEEKMLELQKLLNDVNNRLNTMPPGEAIVTWPGLDDALKGIYREPAPVSDGWIQTIPETDTSQQQTLATSHSFTQTRTPSPPPRPASTSQSSRPSSALSVMSVAQPTKEIQKILKEIGGLTGKHNALEERVQTLEELMKSKADLEEIMKLLGEHNNQAVPEDLAKMLEDLKAGLDSLNSSKEKDSDSIMEMQKLILQMQAEIDKLNKTFITLVDEHNAKQKHIDALYTFVDRLQENKADKEHVTMEIDIKADKRMLEGKVSRTQFQGTVDEISKNLSDVMSKLSGHKEAWEHAVGDLKLGIDNKLDRMELDPLKAYLDKRIRAVDAKVVKTDMQMPEDAAGFRRPLQKFNCISCDRPLDMTPQPPLASLPENKGLPGMRSGRPYTTFELEQIRAAQKKLMFASAPETEFLQLEQVSKEIPGELMRIKHTRQMTDYLKTKQPQRSASPERCGSHYSNLPDYFVTTRSCGGSHTMTYPHRRQTRTATNAQLATIVPTEDMVPVKRCETDIQGADGHIYKARVNPLRESAPERLPTISHSTTTTTAKVPTAFQGRTSSARGRRQPPSSAATERTSPRPSSASARPHSVRQSPRASPTQDMNHSTNNLDVQDVNGESEQPPVLAPKPPE